MTVHVFTGPTLSADDVRAVRPDATVHPPVQHGDLLACHTAAGDIVVIVDGFYHQRASVRHKEILALMDEGVHVVGCSSMGALRAAELHQCGMIGSGVVFEMYRDEAIDADDEVAVVHLADGDLSAHTVPLVSVRWATSQAAKAGVIPPHLAEAIVEAGRSMHYTDRSWRGIRHTVAGLDGDAAPAVDAVVSFLEDHPEHAKIKSRDGIETLRRLPELTVDPPAVGSIDNWRNTHLYEWSVEHRGVRVDDTFVSDGDVIRHRQLYDPEFPTTWRFWVLGELVDADGAAEPQLDRERAAVTKWAPLLRLSERIENPYLTSGERSSLAEGEAVLRTLVRSFESPRGLYDLRLAQPQLTAPDEVHDDIARAKTLNAETWWRGKERMTDRLSRDRLVRHLAQLWGQETSDELLLAAARDRGFASIDAAVAAVRGYFLRDDADAGGTLAARWRTT